MAAGRHPPAGHGKKVLQTAESWYLRHVAQGIGIRITDLRNQSSRDQVFRRLPVRIGRNALNDILVQEGFVSQFHAVLELNQGRLTIRDVGSTNGTQVAGAGRIPPNQAVDLAQHGYQFTIVSLEFRTYTTQVDDIPQSAAAPLRVTSFLQKSQAMAALAQVSDATSDHALATQLRLYSEYRAAWGKLIDSVRSTVSAMPTPQQAKYLAQVEQRFPASGREDDFCNLRVSLGLPGAATGPSAAATTPPAAVALQGLQEMATKQCPTLSPPETVEDVVNFVSRLDEALTVFLRTFIPLRDGQKQLEADLALNPGRGPSKPGTAGTVEDAKTPEDLASLLLRWQGPPNESAQAVESMYADLMIHQVAMLNAVMTGVKSLLHELSPEYLEQVAQDPKQRGGNSLGLGPYRYKALWKLYESRHRDIADEDKQVFSLLFGRDFASAYSQFASQSQSQGHGSLSRSTNPSGHAPVPPAPGAPWPRG